MQQRRLRLGDVIDDYCPRERRITNHVVVALIEDTVKQTRCSTCDADHEYKQAKVPAARRRKTGVAAAQLVEGAAKLPDAVEAHEDELESPDESPALDAADAAHESPETGDEPAEQPELAAAPAPEPEGDAEGAESEEESAGDESDNWPVHRPLIRATLPRPEGHVPERKAPDFTMRQGGKFDANRNGQRHRGPRPARQAFGQSQPGQGGTRFGGQRGPGGPGGGRPGQGQGNRSGQGGGGRPGQGQGQGQGRGPRPPGGGGGGGRKRGR